MAYLAYSSAEEDGDSDVQIVSLKNLLRSDLVWNVAYLDYSSAEEDEDSDVQIVFERSRQFGAGRFGIEFTQTYYF